MKLIIEIELKKIESDLATVAWLFQELHERGLT